MHAFSYRNGFSHLLILLDLGPLSLSECRVQFVELMSPALTGGWSVVCCLVTSVRHNRFQKQTQDKRRSATGQRTISIFINNELS